MARVEKRAVTLVSRTTIFAASALVIALLGCGSYTPPNTIAGTWAGTVTDSLGRQGTASLGLTDNRHDILLGVFSYAASDCTADSKSVIGSIAGGNISLAQTPPDPVPTSLQLTVDTTDQHMTGSYSDTNANCSSSGTIALTKPSLN
jgi:hypothetical protein